MLILAFMALALAAFILTYLYIRMWGGAPPPPTRYDRITITRKDKP